jgi:hypothetical protein
MKFEPFELFKSLKPNNLNFLTGWNHMFQCSSPGAAHDGT